MVIVISITITNNKIKFNINNIINIIIINNKFNKYNSIIVFILLFII